MADLRIVNPKEKAPNKDAINQLERLLAAAKSGKLRSIFWVAEEAEAEDFFSGWANDEKDFRIVAFEIQSALSEFVHTYMEEWADGD